MRAGISTGTCATAAATAAARMLAGDALAAPASVDVVLPDGEVVSVAIRSAELIGPNSARASVVKDAGDDIDVTDGAVVEVTVETGGESGVRFHAGEGVGTVTREGLQLAVGEPAINPVPREMIEAALAREFGGDPSAQVTVSVQGGEALAKKTFNPRLGIEGGISIIGTTGRVEPKSDEAWMRSLLPQVSMARAAGHDLLYLAPGGIGESYAIRELEAPATAVIQCSNFVGDLLDAIADAGATRVVLVGHAGKLVKVAAGIFNTHSRFGDARLETVAALAAVSGASVLTVERILGLATVQAAIDTLREEGLEHVWGAIAERVRERSGQRVDRALDIDVVLLGYKGELLYSTLAPRATVRVPRPISVVGVGPGDPALLTPDAARRIAAADIVVGGARLLDGFAPHHAGERRIVLGADVVSGIRRALDASVSGERVSILASGDPSFFGILATIRREFPDAELEVVPGISSAQIALARAGARWEETVFTSAHGRSLEEAQRTIDAHEQSLVLTDRDNTPVAIASALLAAGQGEGDAIVFERLSYDDERATPSTIAELAARPADSFDPLSIVFFDLRRKENRP